MSNFNYACNTATNTSASAASTTATATGISGKSFQIIGFDGASVDTTYKVELKFGSTVIATMHGGVASSTGRAFPAECGPIASAGTTVTVVTTPTATGQCDANLYYKILL